LASIEFGAALSDHLVARALLLRARSQSERGSNDLPARFAT
jgi:hypothetical protein